MTFLQNAWYCGALSSQASASPIGKTVLGKAIVIYRTADGTALALDGRCPHRFAPLSKGRIVNDAIECPYHGLQFGPSGSCILNPHGDGMIPPGAGLRSYPLVERQGVLWIWMGKPELAAHELILDLELCDAAGYAVIEGMFELEADYRLIIDNLLDLSHAPFIHAATLSGAPAGEPSPRSYHRVSQFGSAVRSEYLFADFPAAAHQRPFIDYDVGDAWAMMEWHAPSNLYMQSAFQPSEAVPRTDLDLPTAHLLTPISATRTAYYYFVGRNKRADDEGMTSLIADVVHRAFDLEDKPIIEACQRLMDGAELMDLRPLILATDAAAIRARRMLQMLIKKEAAVHISEARSANELVSAV